MKCYILRWNQEKSHMTKEVYSKLLDDLHENYDEVGLS